MTKMDFFALPGQPDLSFKVDRQIGNENKSGKIKGQADISMDSQGRKVTFDSVMERVLRHKAIEKRSPIIVQRREVAFAKESSLLATGPPGDTKDLRLSESGVTEGLQTARETAKEDVMDLNEGLQLPKKVEDLEEPDIGGPKGAAFGRAASSGIPDKAQLEAMLAVIQSLLGELAADPVSNASCGCSGPLVPGLNGFASVLGNASAGMQAAGGSKLVERLASLLGVPLDEEAGVPVEESKVEGPAVGGIADQSLKDVSKAPQSAGVKNPFMILERLVKEAVARLEDQLADSIGRLSGELPLVDTQNTLKSTVDKLLTQLLQTSSGESQLVSTGDKTLSPATDAIDPQKTFFPFTNAFESNKLLPNEAAVIRGHQVNTPKFLNDLTGQVVVGYARLSAKDGEMVVRLNPPELGQLTVRVALEDGILKAHFVAPSSDVKQLLDQNLAQLRHMLETQGLSIQDIFVSLQERQNKFQSSEEARQGGFGLMRGIAGVPLDETNRYSVVREDILDSLVNCLA